MTAGADSLTWIGHSTALLDIDGTRLLTDPLLRRRLLLLRRHGREPDPEHLRGLDGILISHPHLDHLDTRSLRMLDRAVPVVVPDGCGALVSGLGFAHVHEVHAGDRVRVGGVEVLAVPAEHDGNRVPWRRGRSGDALGYVIEGAERVYFAGDTDLFGGMAELRPIDVALVPVWGWGPSVGPGHLDPERAAEAVALLGPRIAVPIHWGTFFPEAMHYVPARARLLHDPPHEFAAAVERVAPGVSVEILEPGGTLPLE